MSNQGESADVLEQLSSISDVNLPTHFVRKLSSILEHTKDEIVECLKPKPIQVLKQLREHVLCELVANLSEYAGCELYARKKAETLIEDIYVISFSALSRIPDKKLGNCFRKINDPDASQISVIDDESQQTQDLQSLINLCIRLQNKICSLEEKVKTQDERLEALESQETKRKLCTLNTVTPMDQSMRGGCVASATKAQKSPLLTSDGRKQGLPRNQPPTESRDPASDRDYRQANTVPKPQPSPLRLAHASSGGNNEVPDEKDNSSVAQLQKNRSDTGFRHSTKARRNILRGQAGLNAASGQQDVHGSSTSEHRIKAASTSRTYLIYVGKLSPHTTCDDLRCHLSDVQITDVADVMQLNNFNNRAHMSSFCVSLCSESSMLKTFNSSLWPTGVTVRPFRPARPRRNQPPRAHLRQRKWQPGSYRNASSNQRQRGQERVPHSRADHTRMHYDDYEENRYEPLLWDDSYSSHYNQDYDYMV